jgi:MFS family permease
VTRRRRCVPTAGGAAPEARGAPRRPLVRTSADTGALRLGLGANIGQFSLLVLINAFVGAMVGLERTVVPLIGEREFGLASKTAIVSFIVSFGVTKALLNLVAARLSERVGRKPILVAGWLLGLPVPFMIMWAPSWAWIDAANVLLGANQAFAWSMTVIMKVDLVGPERRGLALGLNEFAGYLSVALSAWLTGEIASLYALRPEPFYYGGIVAILGLGLSALFVRETRVPGGARQQPERRDVLGDLSALLRELRPRRGGDRRHQGRVPRGLGRAAGRHGTAQ